MGFGVYPLLIPSLLLVMAYFLGLFLLNPTFFHKNIQDRIFGGVLHRVLQPGFLLLLALLGVFFACYRGFYTPYHPQLLILPWAFFEVLASLSLLALLWITLFKQDTDLICFIWLFCLGALLFCLATVGFTMLLKPPPLYAAVIDIRYLPFGVKKWINTPGISNLLSLFPMVFLAGILLKPWQRPKRFWTLGLVGFALSLVAAIVIGQRSYFVVSLVIGPVIVAISLLLLRSWKVFLVICALLLSYPLLRWLDQVMGAMLFYRPLNQSLLTDARFQMFRYWLERVTVNPWQRIEVGPAPWNDLQWFHNFFADIHRLSGFWALLAAIALMVFIFFRLLCVIRRDGRLGLFLMAIAIPCFLIMNTSVVPEAERQPFLLMLAIGAISEVILGRSKVKQAALDSH